MLIVLTNSAAYMEPCELPRLVHRVCRPKHECCTSILLEKTNRKKKLFCPKVISVAHKLIFTLKAKRSL